MNPQLPTPEQICESEEFKQALNFMQENKLIRLVTDDNEVLKLIRECNLPTCMKHPDPNFSSNKCLAYCKHKDRFYVFAYWFGREKESENGYGAAEFNLEYMKYVFSNAKERSGFQLFISGLFGFHIDELGNKDNYTKLARNWQNQN